MSFTFYVRDSFHTARGILAVGSVKLVDYLVVTKPGDTVTVTLPGGWIVPAPACIVAFEPVTWMCSWKNEFGVILSGIDDVPAGSVLEGIAEPVAERWECPEHGRVLMLMSNPPQCIQCRRQCVKKVDSKA